MLEFADGVHAELGELAVVGADVSVDGSVEEEVVVAATETVHVEMRGGVIEGQAEIAVAVVGDDAGEGADEELEVAAIEAGLR